MPQANTTGTKQPPRFEPAQELRLAVVLYGGVSLAIYINGVVQELFNLVRATAPERPLGSDPRPNRVAPLGEQDSAGTPGIYRELGRLLRWGDPPPDDFDDEADPVVRTRFVIDVVSGTSAGGLNGIFLAKALANEQGLDDLKKLWVEEGDILRLINDGASVEELRKLPLRKPPASLLNSERFFVKALETLAAMGTEVAGDSRYVDELDLWITSTDLPGLVQPIKLFDRVVWESRHRNVFHFAYWSKYATGRGRNDFVRANDPFLAYAARCTSSFPIAFEPMTLRDIDDAVETFPEYRSGTRASDTESWKKFLQDYVSQDAFYKERAFADGGYLDNKPFTYATRALQRRRADVPVDRKLIYIEPDPGHPEAEYVSAGRPDALNNLQAVFTLPRAETIREDLDALIARNRLIRRRRFAAEAFEIIEDETKLISRTSSPADLSTWRAKDLNALIADWGPAYAAYFRLKVARVINELGNAITRGTGFAEDSDEEFAICALERAWVEERYVENRTESSQNAQTRNQFLFDFDLGYRLRRLNFVQNKIDELLRLDPRAATILRCLASAELPDTSAREQVRRRLLEVKHQLNDIQVSLRTVGRELRARGWLTEGETGIEKNWVSAPELAIVLEGPRGRGLLDRVDPRSVNERAREIVGPETTAGKALTAMHEQIGAQLGTSCREAATKCDAALPPEPPLGPAAPSLAALRNYYDHYENYDMTILPLAEEDAAEADVVEVIRISPEDATSLVDEAKGRHKLGGVAVQHFGGFFDRGWRRNDIMWGRLDAAERILDALLQPEHPKYPELLERAQVAIIREELAAGDAGEVVAILVENLLKSRSGTSAEKALEQLLEDLEGDVAGAVEAALGAALEPKELRTFLATKFTVDRRLDPRTGLAALGRGSRVLGKMLDAMPGNPAVKRPAAWMVRFGSVLWGLVQLATPGTWWRRGFHYWLGVVLAVSLALILVGIFFGVPGAQRSGWILIALMAGGLIAEGVVSDVIHGRTRLRYVILGVALGAALVFAFLELRHIGADASELWHWLRGLWTEPPKTP